MVDTVTTTIEYKGKKFDLVFNLNVMEAIQIKFGTIDKWGELTDPNREEGEPDISAMIFGYEAMLNEGIEIKNENDGTNEPLLTHKQVARIITEIGLQNAHEKLEEVVINSAGDDSKNE